MNRQTLLMRIWPQTAAPRAMARAGLALACAALAGAIAFWVAAGASTHLSPTGLEGWSGLVILGLVSLALSGAAIFAAFRLVQHHADALEEARVRSETAETASRAKSVFLANMSHELRTPLNAIIGFSEVMVQEMFGPMGARQYSEYARDIHASGQTLLELINNLVLNAKVEAGKIDVDMGDCDVRRTIADACARLADDNPGKVVQIALTDDIVRASCDEGVLHNIILHLLNHAMTRAGADGQLEISATHVAGAARVTIAWMRPTGVDGRIVVKPPGPGTGFGGSFAKMADVFERAHGAGMSLTLASGFAALVGGTVSDKDDVIILDLAPPHQRVETQSAETWAA